MSVFTGAVHSRGREEYLLTTKLFCGYCREMMTGYGGTGKSGTPYRYYACKSAKKKTCRKKVINKQKIEDRVVLECRKLLTDSNIEKIALAVSAVCEADYNSSAIKRIKAAIQEADAAIENLWKALERGQAVDMITERIDKRKREKDELQGQLAIEMGKLVTFTAPQIKAFLYSLKRGDVNDENSRRWMVNIFLRAIYLYDDRMTPILNGGDRSITIDDILLDEIEEHFEAAISSHAGCSPLVAAAPPIERYTNTRTKASLAVYDTQRYGFNVNSSSISQTKRKYGFIADSGDAERHYIQMVKLEKEAAIRKALVWFGVIKRK